MKYVFAIFVPALISGCSGGVPDCSSSKTKDLAIEIITQQLEESFNAHKGQMVSMATSYGLKFDEDYSSIKFELDNTTISDKNEKTEKYTCQADLISRMGDNKFEAPIAYTSELVNDGEKHLVRVYGLDEEKQGELLMSVMSSK